LVGVLPGHGRHVPGMLGWPCGGPAAIRVPVLLVVLLAGRFVSAPKERTGGRPDRARALALARAGSTAVHRRCRPSASPGEPLPHIELLDCCGACGPAPGRAPPPRPDAAVRPRPDPHQPNLPFPADAYFNESCPITSLRASPGRRRLTRGPSGAAGPKPPGAAVRPCIVTQTQPRPRAGSRARPRPSRRPRHRPERPAPSPA